MKKQTKSTGRNILTVLLSLVIVACAAFLIWQWIQERRDGQKQEALKEQAVKEETTKEEDQIENPIDFTVLQEENPDIYAWIRIPDTQIDYPILQTGNTADLFDEYYLRRLPDRTNGVAGSIFSQRINAADFSDRNTVLYGHNMRNGTMFADLHKYEDQAFMDSHNQIYIYTPEHVYVYHVIAAVPFSADHVMVRYGFDTAEDTQAYLTDINNAGGVYAQGTEVSAEDHLLTLSTCITQQANKRYLVVAKLQTAQ